MKMLHARLWASLVLVVTTVSCGHYSKLVEVHREGRQQIPRVWLVTSITLEQRVPDPSSEKKIPELLNLAGSKFSITIATDKSQLKAGEPYAQMSLWIKEQSYTRSLDQYNSIAALLTLTDPPSGELLARAFISEETEDSIKSLQRLYRLLDELMQNLVPKL